MVVSGRGFAFEGGSTVEILVEETWSYVASLPSPRYYHKAATLANSVSVFGK